MGKYYYQDLEDFFVVMQQLGEDVTAIKREVIECKEYLSTIANKI